MSNSKYVGNVYCGVWKCEKLITSSSSHSSKYVLTNIYNKQEIHISTNQMKDIAEGKLQVSTVISNRINRKNSHINLITN